MRGTTGKCPGCDGTGTVAEPCDERGCKKRDLHYISDAHWAQAHPDNGTHPDPIIGQMVGDFLVVGLIGSGGFGKVYLAYQTPLLRLKGALKLIDVPTDDPEFSKALLKKFQSEAEVLAHLTHPNIVRLLKYGLHATRPYLVMEFVDGDRTLRNEIHARTVDERGFSADELLDIFNQVINGLGAAHEESIIHRDVKPENIMLQSVVGNPHHVRLLDFGLAKFVEHHTDTRWHLGSPNYMAPEQVSRKNLGPWTDLYAVTVILFELLSGRRPFPGASEEEILIKKIKDDFDPLSVIDDLDFPQPTIDLLSTGLARDPEQRFQDVESLRAMLHPALESMADRLGSTGAKISVETAQLGTRDILAMTDRESLDDKPTRRTATDDSTSPTEPRAHQELEETRRANAPSLPPTAPPSSGPEERDGSPPQSNTPPATPDGTSMEQERMPRRFIWGLSALGVAIVGLGLVGLMGDFFDASVDPVAPEAVDAQAEERAQYVIDTVPTDMFEQIHTQRVTTALHEAQYAIAYAAGGAAFDIAAHDDEAADLPRVRDMALGKFHTCILLRQGDMRCWGGNFEGELGLGHRQSIGDTEPASTADFVDVGEPVIAISAAGDHNASFSCAMLESRRVRCWGSNHFGQLGLGRDVRRIGVDELPVEIDPIELGGPAVQLASGAMQYATHACALLESNDLRCWGNNRYGQLGLGHNHHIGQAEVPAHISPIEVGDGDIAQVEAGKFHTCVRFEHGGVRCWGRNNTGQLGYGHTDDLGGESLPADLDLVDLGASATQISLGRGHSCAVVEGNRARCWGWNQFGQLGYGHTDNIGDDDAPAEAGDIELGAPVEKIAAGGLHTCALLEEGRIKCWGDNRFGQLGYGHRRTIGDDDVPADIHDVYLGGRAVALETANYHSCALLEDDTLRCWGFNEFGQLGYGHSDHIGTSEAPASAGPVPAFRDEE